MVILMSVGGWIGILIAVAVACFVGGFFTARLVIKKELKKHPPISENAIRAMYREMGMKPSEAKIKAIMKKMQEAQ